jgi:voltage-gated potassium channel
MHHKPFQVIIGLAGVAPDETEQAQRAGRRFEIPMLILAIWILLQWYMEKRGLISMRLAELSDLLIWIFFIFESTTLTWLVKDKLRHLRNNWINVVIILLGIPIIWGFETYAGALRSLRLLLMAAILFNMSETARQILARNHLGTTLLIAAGIIIIGGVMMAGIDPAIGSVGQGLWWAWVTVTTVGYGDLVPSSDAGKLFGAFLILMGIGMFSLLTASFSAFFISKEETEHNLDEEILDRLNKINERLDGLESSLKQVKKKPDSQD